MSATKTATVITPATVISAIVEPAEENIFEPQQLVPEEVESKRYATLWAEVLMAANTRGNKGHIVPMSLVETMLFVLAKNSNKAANDWSDLQEKHASNQYAAKHLVKIEYAAKLSENMHNELVYVMNKHKGHAGIPLAELMQFETHDAFNTNVLNARLSDYDILKLVQGYRVANPKTGKNYHKAGMTNFRYQTNMMNLYPVQDGFRVGMNGCTLHITGEQAHRIFSFATMSTLQEAPVSQDCVFKQNNRIFFDGYTVLLTPRKDATQEDNRIYGTVVRKPAGDEEIIVDEPGYFDLANGPFRLICSNQLFRGLFESVVFGKYGAKNWNNYALLSDAIQQAYVTVKDSNGQVVDKVRAYEVGHIPANKMEIEHFWALGVAQVKGGRDASGNVRFISKKAEEIEHAFRDHGYFYYQNIDSLEQLLDRDQFEKIYTHRMEVAALKRAENRAKREAAKSQEQQEQVTEMDIELALSDEHPF